MKRVYGAIGFGFDSHWLKNWRKSFNPITKRSNPNHVNKIIVFNYFRQSFENCSLSNRDNNININYCCCCCYYYCLLLLLFSLGKGSEAIHG